MTSTYERKMLASPDHAGRAGSYTSDFLTVIAPIRDDKAFRSKPWNKILDDG